MRIIYRKNSELSNRWRIDLHPNEKIENIGYISRRLYTTAPENSDFLQIQKNIEQYCNELNLQAMWCI